MGSTYKSTNSRLPVVKEVVNYQIRQLIGKGIDSGLIPKKYPNLLQVGPSRMKTFVKKFFGTQQTKKK